MAGVRRVRRVESEGTENLEAGDGFLPGIFNHRLPIHPQDWIVGSLTTLTTTSSRSAWPKRRHVSAVIISSYLDRTIENWLEAAATRVSYSSRTKFNLLERKLLVPSLDQELSSVSLHLDTNGVGNVNRTLDHRSVIELR